ncbi:Rad60/SUMO-like domain [Dillenia turbinata]|uniref:Rad60/SUMO-like domain n=1 Tax=Dillenia turbinata TaxID=194707 RepID=A0AAN8WE11_9MAGN
MHGLHLKHFPLLVELPLNAFEDDSQLCLILPVTLFSHFFTAGGMVRPFPHHLVEIWFWFLTWIALQDGNEVFFRIKRSTQLKKLMNAYCDRQSVELNSIAFLFDGRRLRGEQTPEELEMEDGDEIDAMLHQTGGHALVMD